MLKKNNLLAKKLIARGANVNDTNPTNGLTPLHIAISNQDLELVKLLVAKGASMEAVELKNHLNPFEFAMKLKKTEIIDFLKKYKK